MKKTSVFTGLALVCCLFQWQCAALVPASSSGIIRSRQVINGSSVLYAWGGNDNKDDAAIEEEARLRIYESRRGQIRQALKSAEGLRNFRAANGLVPELDEEGNPIKSDGKFALTATAFVVTFGAIALRIGGRAALVSAVGLDFIADNPELQSQMTEFLDFTETMDPLLKAALFISAWTLVKVFCVDAGGVVLALSAGILFGGVIQGAVVSAFAATVGSSAAFGLAKLDTPVRKKALEVVEENPSLRGIEKVVAKDGIKAVLTLRLAPVLPIPIGLYNYVYGVTNVPYFDFAGGIFLGSLKPYLLDSYLGYFGKSVVDGSINNADGVQDVLLLVALGFSVLIGVFASQLAGETWDEILAEEEAAKAATNDDDEEVDDGIVREVFGKELPEWMVGFQLSLQAADERIDEIILQEFDAKVWNYTDSQGNNPVPRELNPAYDPNSPEMVGAFKGIDYAASICDGLVLSPSIFKYYFRWADPLFDEEEFNKERSAMAVTTPPASSVSKARDGGQSVEVTKGELLTRLQIMRDRTTERIEELDRRIEQDKI